MILKVFSRLNSSLIQATVVSLPHHPHTPLAAPALLPPLDDCQIFLLPGNDPPILSPLVKHRGSLCLRTAPERTSSGDWGGDPSLF